jgi:uroporphyrin-III C-methyltransferase
MGIIYIVGAGPGDPGLLTIRAGALLAKADVVIYDRLVSAEILTLANPSAKLIFAGKRKGEQQVIQAEINKLMLRYGRVCDTVVRLKGGDPTVFGRGAEEIAFLQARGFAVELVPGISSAIAGPALAGIPLTCRGVASSFTVVAGHKEQMQEQNWQRFARVDTLVILMGVENRAAIARELIACGRPSTEPVAFLTRAATEREVTVIATLAEVASGTTKVESPSIFVIGEVVRLRTQLKGIGFALEGSFVAK